MRRWDQSKIWAASPKFAQKSGISEGGYTDLRAFYANIQTLSNEEEARIYGDAANNRIVLRVKEPPVLAIRDVLYLQEPSPAGTFQIGDESWIDYGKGEYQVESVVSARFGVKMKRNPTTIIAKKLV